MSKAGGPLPITITWRRSRPWRRMLRATRRSRRRSAPSPQKASAAKVGRKVWLANWKCQRSPNAHSGTVAVSTAQARSCHSRELGERR